MTRKATSTDLGFRLDAETERVWLHIRDQGGWWTAEEIHEHWYPTFRPAWLRTTLRVLDSHGFVASRLHIDKGVRAYGVTKACTPLLGHTLEPRPC